MKLFFFAHSEPEMNFVCIEHSHGRLNFIIIIENGPIYHCWLVVVTRAELLIILHLFTADFNHCTTILDCDKNASGQAKCNRSQYSYPINITDAIA